MTIEATRSEQICFENNKFIKAIAVFAAVAIPIITTTFAYVGAFKLLKLRIINPKFALALKIITPAMLGFGIGLIEIPIYVCIFSKNQKRNDLILEEIIDEEIIDEEIID